MPAPVIAPAGVEMAALPVAPTFPSFPWLLPQHAEAGGQAEQDLPVLAPVEAGAGSATDPVTDLAPAGLAVFALVSGLLSSRRRAR